MAVVRHLGNMMTLATRTQSALAAGPLPPTPNEYKIVARPRPTSTKRVTAYIRIIRTKLSEGLIFHVLNMLRCFPVNFF